MNADALTLGVLSGGVVLLAALVAGGVTLAVQLARWNAENRQLWHYCRQLIDHIYRGSPPPPPAPPPGLFD